MLLPLYTLPKLAVSANLLCLLMVAICGSAQSVTRYGIRLYNECAGAYIMMHSNGTVMANKNETENPYQMLALTSHNYSSFLHIKAEKANRYLCFNKRGILIGLKKPSSGFHCEFNEAMTKEYFTYESKTLKGRFIGLTRRGKQSRRELNRKCYNFLKRDPKFNIQKHNARKGGGTGVNMSPPLTQHPRRHHKGNRRHQPPK